MPTLAEMERNSSYAIGTPGPYDPPEVWWAFLRGLRDLDPNDPAVQDARRETLHLVVENHHEREIS